MNRWTNLLILLFLNVVVVSPVWGEFLVEPGVSVTVSPSKSALMAKLPTCKGDEVWDQIVVESYHKVFKKKLEKKSIRTWLGRGSKNCLAIGSEVPFVRKVSGEDGVTVEPIAGRRAKIERITQIPVSSLLSSKVLRRGVAVELGYVNGDGVIDEVLDEVFTRLIEAFSEDGFVNLTEFQWLDDDLAIDSKDSGL